MALHTDLLNQAAHLARRERLRPTQASLRRAVSTAYYALFHFLADRASRLLVRGETAERRALRAVVARAFEHRQMKRASKLFAPRPAGEGGRRASAAGANPWLRGLPGEVPADLAIIAQTFVDLQQARHQADYDLARSFRRSEALAYVERARVAIGLWRNVKDTPHAGAYLLALLLKTRG